MFGSILPSSAILCYLIASFLVFRSLRGNSAEANKSSRAAMLLATTAVGLQTIWLFTNATVLDFSLSSMALVVSCVVVATFLLGCLGLEIQKLGIMVYPLAATSLLFGLYWNGGSGLEPARQLLPLSAFSTHVLVSILAYSLITIAAIQSILYLYQEIQFKQRATPTMLASLPPLQTMEVLLFRLVGIGFLLLSLTLLSGALFSKEIFGRAFEFNHHTVLALLGWLVFAVLLYRRRSSGLRGLPATAWTLLGFALIQLGYFGTKIVNESLNL